MVAAIGPFQSAAARGAEPPADHAQRARADRNAVVVAVSATVTVTIGVPQSNLFTPYDASGRWDGGRPDPLTAMLTEEQREEKEQGDALVRQLDAMRDSQKSDRREALMQKIEQIKKQLQMLRALAAVNPQAAAKQAAQLSRELAQAAKAYAAAGAPADAAAAPSADAAAAAPADAAAAAPADMGATAPDTAATEAPAESGTDAEPGQSAVTSEAEAESAKTGKAAEDGEAKSPIAAMVGPDDDTVREAKNVARQLKAVIEQARAEANRRRQRDEAIEEAGAEANGALRDLDEAGDDLKAQAVAAASDPVAVDAAPMPEVAPTVSILV